MRSKIAAALALAALVLSSIPVFAHHGTAAFQNEKRVTLKGTVTEWLLVESALPAAV